MNTRIINEITNGTVIDHIEAGQSCQIYKLIALVDSDLTVTIGIRLSSSKMGQKDVIKVEGKFLTPKEVETIALFAPRSTLSIIKDQKVVEKFKPPLAQEISGVFDCHNAKCISHSESIPTRFRIERRFKSIQLECAFCQGKWNLHDTSFIHDHLQRSSKPARVL